MVRQQLETGEEPSYHTHTHAEYVGPGLLIMGSIQGKYRLLVYSPWLNGSGIDIEPLKKAYSDAGLSYNAFPLDLLDKTLRALPQYCHEHPSLAYSVAHTLTQEQIDAIDLATLFS